MTNDELRSEDLCVAKIEFVSGTQCHVELIFNGATEVAPLEIYLPVAAHIEVETLYDGDVEIQTSHQVGEAGYAPFVDKLKELYPNVLIVDKSQFDTMVEMQKECASALVQ